MNEPRYQSLDAWRGLAALAVMSFHALAPALSPDTPGAPALLIGWTGVYIFFPISGYCIAGAAERARSGPRAFLWRRWVRIFPPYWVSLIACIAVALLAAPFNHASLEYLSLRPGQWLAMASLTQGLAGIPERINIVYWSLCLEEQFYLIVALSLLLPRYARGPLFIGLSLLSIPYSAWAHPPVENLCLPWWPGFAAGAATYAWLRGDRREALVGWGAAALALAADPRATSAVSLGVALLLALLAPYDRRIAAHPAVRPLLRAGVYSYSLYLIHVPIGARAANLWLRLSDQLALPGALRALGSLLVCGAVSLTAAMLLNRFVEAPFIARARRAAG